MNSYGIICCDAGAANQLMAYLKDQPPAQMLGFFSGPAAKICDVFLPDMALATTLEDVIDASDIVITGTGWSSELEHEARILASKKGKLSIAVIDHWVNYKQRFERDGIEQYPDVIWVFDEMAYRLASCLFDDIEIELKNPSYQNHVIGKVSQLPSEPNSFLYFCEPIRQQAINGVTMEERQLDAFLKKLSLDKTFAHYRVYLRLHPSEPAHKYDHILANYQNLTIRKDDLTLEKSLCRSGAVVGCSTYALYLAHHANRKTYSSKIESGHDSGFSIDEIIPMDTL